jgi:hypothetical protein
MKCRRNLRATFPEGAGPSQNDASLNSSNDCSILAPPLRHHQLLRVPTPSAPNAGGVLQRCGPASDGQRHREQRLARLHFRGTRRASQAFVDRGALAPANVNT